MVDTSSSLVNPNDSDLFAELFADVGSDDQKPNSPPPPPPVPVESSFVPAESALPLPAIPRDLRCRCESRDLLCAWQQGEGVTHAVVWCADCAKWIKFLRQDLPRTQPGRLIVQDEVDAAIVAFVQSNQSASIQDVVQACKRLAHEKYTTDSIFRLAKAGDIRLIHDAGRTLVKPSSTHPRN